jgi:hypothetical protein
MYLFCEILLNHSTANRMVEISVLSKSLDGNLAINVLESAEPSRQSVYNLLN